MQLTESFQKYSKDVLKRLILTKANLVQFSKFLFVIKDMKISKFDGCNCTRPYAVTEFH